MSGVPMQVRETLRERQRGVLDDLLAGRTPPGFAPAGTALATRVLLTKRAVAAERLAPEAAEWAGWREAFRDWAAEHPAEGCAHDDLRRFAEWLRADQGTGRGTGLGSGRCWARVHAVHEGWARIALGRLDGRLICCLALGDRAWTWRSKASNRGKDRGRG